MYLVISGGPLWRDKMKMKTGKNTNLNPSLLISVILLTLVLSSLLLAQTVPPSPYWKNQIVFPDEPFRVQGTSTNDPDWVKFTILLAPYEPNIVYFQDCRKYTFHYNFAVELLPPFYGMTPQQFDQATLYELGQQAILGAVIMPPSGGYPPPPPYQEYGIQFVRRDPYTKEEIAELFNIVKAGITADPNVRAFYFPSYEQIATAEDNREWFESQGIPISSTARWLQGNCCYSTGWTLGKLKYVEGDNIDSAYRSGLLKPDDILLTDGVPADVPLVCGIITLSPSTPNSHVAILAKTFGVPFVYLALAEDAERALQLVGHGIVLRVFEVFRGCDVRLIDTEGVLDASTIEEILALKKPPALNITPMADYGDYSAPTDGLLPGDIKYFGGKAANYGILRTSIPNDCRVAVAFSFKLWNEFLSQTLANGKSLRKEISDRLSQYTYPPSDMSALWADLDDIRDMFTDTDVTIFTQTQTNAIISILQDPLYGFDPKRKIRFRSSSNVEDSNQFTGAGLYDSFSGCLADDLDGDNSGPCLCDPNESHERGVFRAIRKVFASFYNNNAFLERLRYDVNESQVGMALLVHHSTPDLYEMANGVATIEPSYLSGWDIKLVTQYGATSVANAEDGSIPEEVSVGISSYGTYLTVNRYSNLVPLGAMVMNWQDDYINLSQLLIAAAGRFRQVTGKTNFLLDLEYKKVAPQGKLLVKQVREIPRPGNAPDITPFLINEPAQYCTFQGEFADVFANHRLKSRWLFETQSIWLTKTNLIDSFYANVMLEYTDTGRIRTVTGILPFWPFAAHTVEDASIKSVNTYDNWLMHHLANRRSCRLRTENIPIQVEATESPILTLLDLWRPVLHVKYDGPVPSWDWSGPKTTTEEEIQLFPCPEPQPGDLLQQGAFTWPNGVSIKTLFYWPPDPGAAGGYTAPLSRWVETIIEGYTTKPIVLHGWYSQTYKPEHHNFREHFLFEPQLEPNLPQVLSAELRAKNIRLIHVIFDSRYDPNYITATITTYGFDDQSFLAGDIDKNKKVNFDDLKLFTGRWLDAVCDTCSGADLTGDGQVTLFDFQILAENWLATLP
jgi:hypothetical protein